MIIEREKWNKKLREQAGNKQQQQQQQTKHGGA